jgi:hypothetical protein
MDMFQLTIWDDPLSPVLTKDGTIPYHRWIAERATDLNAAGIKTEIRTRKPDHFTALFRARGKSRTEAR